MPLDRIVDAALHIVDTQGAQTLSMRALATQLGAGTATFYRHFAGRTELIAHVVDRVVGELTLDGAELESMPWPDACRRVVTGMYATLKDHGNVAVLLVETVPVGPAALALREAVLKVLLDNGFSPTTAATAYATLSRFALGFAIQHSADSSDSSRTLFANLDPGQFPATVAAADALPVPLDDEFTFGLELLIRGLSGVLGDEQTKI